MRQSLTEAVLNLVHPTTGEAPVGFRKPRPGRGEVGFQPIWRIAGGSGEDDDDDPDDTGDGGDGSGGDGDGNDNAGSAGDGKQGDPRIKELSDENARRRNEAKTLKQQLADAQAKLKEHEDAGLGELDKAKSDLESTTAENAKLAEAILKLRIDNAFLSSNKHTWKNPKAALRLVDLSEVEIDDDGEVTGLDKALDALAKSDPYLLADSGDDDGDGDGTPTGQNPVPKKQKKGDPGRDALTKKYPALRR